MSILWTRCIKKQQKKTDTKNLHSICYHHYYYQKFQKYLCDLRKAQWSLTLI